MRIMKYMLAASFCLLAMPALAQPPEGEGGGDRPAPDPAIKQKLLDNFDTNKDGTIDRSEAREIGRGLRDHFDVGPPGRGPEGRGPRDRGPGGPDGRGRGDRADRGPEGPPRDGRGPEGRSREGRGPEGWRGPRGEGGRPPGPNPERVFNVFDENGDGSLSKEEFVKLSEFMRSLHRQNSQSSRQEGGRGFERRGDGPPGPPRDFEGRGRGDGRGRGEGRRGWGGGPPGPPRPDGPPGPPPEDGAAVDQPPAQPEAESAI